jgi:hypothetical protein
VYRDWISDTWDAGTWKYRLRRLQHLPKVERIKQLSASPIEIVTLLSLNGYIASSYITGIMAYHESLGGYTRYKAMPVLRSNAAESIHLTNVRSGIAHHWPPSSPLGAMHITPSD